MVVDKEIGLEWTRIPHFSTTIVYQYATGYSRTGIKQANLRRRKTCGGALQTSLKQEALIAINVLKKAGVDMASKNQSNDDMSIVRRKIKKKWKSSSLKR
ncbi:hypothetical protein ACEQPO_09405 [Bacillus sp. SL00103]